MNIELHGFLPKHAEKIGKVIWYQITIGLPFNREMADYAVTIVRSRSYDHKGKNAPFFRVFSDNPSDFELASKLLRPERTGAGMKTFIECVRLEKCLEV